MGAFWNQVINFVQPSDRPAERLGAIAAPDVASVAPQRYSPNASLESIGMQNETLRAQIEEVEHGFWHLEQVKGVFHGLLSPMSELLTEFEATKLRLHEMKIKLAIVEDAHEGSNARHAAALEERDLVAEARNTLLRENREMGQRVQRVDAALSETQIDLRKCSAEKEKFERLFEAETRQTASQGEKILRLKDELSRKDQKLASLELSLNVANDQCALLSQENATLRDSSQGLSNNLDVASRRIADYEAQVDQDKYRIAALEQALSEEQAAHASLRAKHLEHVERSHAEISTLNNTVHAVRGRVDMTNKIIDQTRAQLREKIEESRAAERRMLETGIQIDSLEKTARSQKDDLAVANERIAGAEKMRGALVDQVNGLTETLRAKEAALQSATRTIEQLSARADEMANGRQRAKEELERRTAALQDEIARMRAERQLADGALEASRAERKQARRAPPTIGDAQREATAESSAPEAVEPPVPQQTNVTKLPLAALL
jgi:chromosome segregation ATPase